MPRKATGQLILRKNGYYGRYLATVDGVRKHVFTFLETKNELIARRRLDALIAAEEAAHEPTVAETFEQAALRVHETRIKTLPSARGELSYMRKHVNPVIGRVPAREVTKADVMSVLEAVRDKGHAQQTILHVRNAVSAVFKALRREGVVQALPLPSVDELPECLPEAIDERPKSVLSDDELLTYLAYSDPRKGEAYQGAVRERQLMALLSRCVGGMRTAELQGLTWARARAEGAAFDALEVIRYKTRRKASRQGSKAIARQLYPLGDTVLPCFLRYWHLRHCVKSGEPSPDAVLFPVRRESSRGEGRVGERRTSSTWARALRRDVKRAFGLEAFEGGQWKDKKTTDAYSRRMLELLEGTDDRRPLWMHNSRNAAAVMAERQERLKAAARVTGHASARMLQHYREMAGEVDVVPVVPEFLPDAERLEAVLREWCRVDGIDPALVFPAAACDESPRGPDDSSRENAPGKRTGTENEPKRAKVVALGAPKRSDFEPSRSPGGFLSERSQVRLLVGAPVIPGTSPTAPGAEHGDKRTRKPHSASKATENQPSPVAPLPAGAVTLADVRKALDAALIDGDVHRARRLNALAAEFESLGLAPSKGERDAEEA
jgi:site-specific recombinase XerD